MKNYIQYLPLTAFAAAFMLGGSLSAEQTSGQGTNLRDQQRHSQLRDRNTDDEQNTSAARTSQDRTGQDRTGQERIGQDRVGQDRTSQERTRQDRTGQGGTNQDHARPMSASKVLGMSIDTAGNEKIGEIDEIFIDTNSGEVLAMVVSTGGFLGMGQQQSLISPEDLRLNNDRALMRADLSKEQIRNAPSYRKGQTTGLDRVRPLGHTAADWDARKERQDRADTRSTSGFGQTDSNNRTTGTDRADRTERTDRQERADRTQTRSTAGTGQSDYNRRTTGDDRSDSWDRTDRTDRADRTVQTDRQGRSDRSVQANGRGLGVSDLIGMSVENRQGESVGKVDGVYLDLEKSEVVGVVVSTGGFLGMGNRKTLFGLREMSFDHENETVLLDYSREQIRGYPEYKENDQSVFSSLRERTDRMGPRASGDNARNQGDRARVASTRNQGDSARNQSDSARTVGSSSDRTVFDQGNSSGEIAMTASIRTAIREDSALSNRANNVTIITKDGKVVLRGEVDSASEKSTVEGIAHNKAGRQNVTSELVVRGSN